MKLSLINPPTVIAGRHLRHYQMPPLGLCYLAAAAREAGHEVDVVDAQGEALDRYHPYRNGYELHGMTVEEVVARVDPATEVIGLSCMFSNHWPITRELAGALREAFPEVPIIAGSEHVTAAPEHALESAPVDYAVLGEGEETLLELLEALSKEGPSDVSGIAGLVYRDAFGEIRRTPPRARMRDIDSIPWPAWDLVPIRRYIDTNEFVEPSARRVISMLGTRGCPFQCKFCSNPQMWTTRFYMRDPKNLVDEMEYYEREYGVTEFQFFDLTFIINRAWVIEVADEIIRRGKDWVWKLPTGTRSETFNEELLRKISESGCRSLTLAPETGSPRLAEAMRKPLDLDRFPKIGRLVRRNGIDMSLNFYMIIGAPEERLRDVLLSYRFMMRMALAGFDSMGINKFMTYPGSAYHAEFRARGQIEYDDDYFLGLHLDNKFDSYNEGLGFDPPWGPRQIWLIVNLGYLLFYGTYYLSHPARMIRSAVSIARDRPRNRLEAIFSQWLRGLRRRLVPGGR